MEWLMEKLLEMIRQAKNLTAFTGAGVSALSGLPCFGGDREDLFGAAAFERDPWLFYRNAGPLLYHGRGPSLVHRVLAGWEKRGFLAALITQNIDMLHQKAGSRRVIEIHGSPAVHYCPRCPGVRTGFDEAASAFYEGRLPLCPGCGRPLKPAVTLYGEPLPLEARRAAEDAASLSDLMLVLGTSLAVSPASDIPRTTLRRGGRVIIINKTATPLDGEASFRFDNLETAFGFLERRL
jgi:NAD-dependent deacetylase